MAKARAIDSRRKSVTNIQKITRTMQLIATARYQQSLAKAVASKPYTDKISELVQDVSSAGSADDHPLLKQNEESRKRALLLLTSNRGFCGGLNANLIRTASAVISDNLAHGFETDMYVVGKKGVKYFSFIGQDITRSFPELPDAPTFAHVQEIADDFMTQFTNGTYNAVQVTYMRFLSTARQEPETAQLLPLQKTTDESQAENTETTASSDVVYDYSPDPSVLLAELLPVTVRIRLYQFFNDAVVSENVARMVAMKSATDAAGDMKKMLTREFNRARQSQITTELLDIMGGVEALK